MAGVGMLGGEQIEHLRWTLPLYADGCVICGSPGAVASAEEWGAPWTPWPLCRWLCHLRKPGVVIGLCRWLWHLRKPVVLDGRGLGTDPTHWGCRHRFRGAGWTAACYTNGGCDWVRLTVSAFLWEKGAFGHGLGVEQWLGGEEDDRC